MTKFELIQQIAQTTGLKQSQVEAVLRNLSSTVADRLKAGDKVSITGFGTFATTKRGSRKVRNPMTGELMQVPEMKIPKFRAGESLKRAVR